MMTPAAVTGTTTRTFAGPLGWWTHHVWRPGPADPLAGIVEQLTHSDCLADHPRERVLPTGAIELMVHLDAPYRLVSAGVAEPCAVVSLSAPGARPLLLEPPVGRAAMLALRLAPAAAHLLVGAPLSASGLAGPAVDLEPILGRAAHELAERCADAPSPEGRIAAAAHWARRRLARTTGVAGVLAGPIAWACARIARHRGAVAIAELGAASGLSAARFGADFRRAVGIGPKTYARLARFGHALALLERRPPRPLAAIALDAGYYDQAHMTAEFRMLGGITPARVRTRERYWDGPAVVEPGHRRRG